MECVHSLGYTAGLVDVSSAGMVWEMLFPKKGDSPWISSPRGADAIQGISCASILPFKLWFRWVLGTSWCKIQLSDLKYNFFSPSWCCLYLPTILQLLFIPGSEFLFLCPPLFLGSSFFTSTLALLYIKYFPLPTKSDVMGTEFSVL